MIKGHFVRAINQIITQISTYVISSFGKGHGTVIVAGLVFAVIPRGRNRSAVKFSCS